MKQFLFGFLVALFALFGSNAEAQQTGPIYCGASVTQTVGAAIGQVVAAPGTGSAKVYICSYTIANSNAAANTVTFQYGTGTNCGTGTTTFGPTVIIAATSTFTEGADTWHGFVTPVGGQAVCVTPSVASAIVTIYYTLM